MVGRGRVIAAGLSAGLLVLAASAEAQITLRAASSAAASAITFVGHARMPASDGANTAATNATITVGVLALLPSVASPWSRERSRLSSEPAGSTVVSEQAVEHERLWR
jgi:hypothetical protein